MVQYYDYLILENEEDFLKDWDKEKQQWNGDCMEIPKTFPCAFVYINHDLHFCGSWKPLSTKEVKEQIQKLLQEEIARREKILMIVNKIKT